MYVSVPNVTMLYCTSAEHASLHISLSMADTQHCFNDNHEIDMLWITQTILLFGYL